MLWFADVDVYVDVNLVHVEVWGDWVDGVG